MPISMKRPLKISLFSKKETLNFINIILFNIYIFDNKYNFCYVLYLQLMYTLSRTLVRYSIMRSFASYWTGLTCSGQWLSLHQASHRRQVCRFLFEIPVIEIEIWTKGQHYVANLVIVAVENGIGESTEETDDVETAERDSE